jgi:hypothetical protein
VESKNDRIDGNAGEKEVIPFDKQLLKAGWKGRGFGHRLKIEKLGNVNQFI